MGSQIPGQPGPPGQPGSPRPGPNQMPPQMFPSTLGQPGSTPTSFSQFKSRFGLGQSGLGSGFGFGPSGFGQMGPQMTPPMNTQGTRQYTLEATPGFPGSGIATISGELQLMIVASMPPPAPFVNTPSAIYVAYLVDKKGQQGFAAGKLTPARDGASHLSFISPVPLSNYTRVVISIEDPHKIQAYPQGPIVLKVKDDFRTRLTQGDFTKGAFNQVKKAGGFVQEKVGGFFRGRFGKTPAPVPTDNIAGVNPAAAAPELGAAGIGAGVGIAAASQTHMPPIPQTQVPPPPIQPAQPIPPQMAYPSSQAGYPTPTPQTSPQEYVQTQNSQPPTQPPG